MPQADYCLSSFVSADEVEGTVDRNPVNPGGKGCRMPERSGCIHDLNEDLLRKVFRILHAPGEIISRFHNLFLIVIDQILKGSAVTPENALNEFGIGHQRSG